MIGYMVRKGMIELTYVNPDLKVYVLTEYGLHILEKCDYRVKRKKGFYIDE